MFYFANKPCHCGQPSLECSLQRGRGLLIGRVSCHKCGFSVFDQLQLRHGDCLSEAKAIVTNNVQTYFALGQERFSTRLRKGEVVL